jgi:hypothetical protein
LTWHHVAALMLAVALVVGAAWSPGAKEILPGVLQLATGIVTGVFGHAGASVLRRRTEHTDPGSPRPS